MLIDTGSSEARACRYLIHDNGAAEAVLLIMAERNGSEGLRGVAERLAERREIVLEKLRGEVTSDPGISTARSLTQEGFRDNLPGILDALIQRLEVAALHGKSADPPERIPAQMHGQHRWQQGYSLSEAISEWRHLSGCLIQEFGDYASRDPRISPGVLIAVMREVSELIGAGVAASAEQHTLLQRSEATTRRDELQAALEQVRTLEEQRSQKWRQAVHDLRGSVGAITNASTLLKRPEATENIRDLSHEALTRGLTTIRQLLEELASLARLEAGQDQVRVCTFDVSEVLGELAVTVRPFVLERGLVLDTQGSGRLEVEGDPTKVQRVAQNLLLNAIRYTERGGVSLAWHPDEEAPADRWRLLVEDTGPGIPAGAPNQSNPDAMHSQETATTGEGIGLSIVRRLCDLLGARIELDTQPGRGTIFNVIFPRRYHP